MKLLLAICLGFCVESVSAQLLPENLTLADAELRGKVRKVVVKAFDTDAQGKKTGSPLEEITEYYNEAGFITKRIQKKDDGKGGMDEYVTNFLYNNANQLVKIEYPDDPDYNLEFSYRTEGDRLYRTSNESGNFYVFSFNSRKELIKYEEFLKGVSKPSEAKEYVWSNGLISSVKHYIFYVGAASLTEVKYDANKNLVETKESDIIDIKTGKVDHSYERRFFTYSGFDAQNNWQRKFVKVEEDSDDDDPLFGVYERTIEYYNTSSTTSTASAENIKQKIKSQSDALMHFIEEQIGLVYPKGGGVYNYSPAQKIRQYVTIYPDSYNIKLEKFRTPLDCKVDISSINTHEIVNFNLKDLTQLHLSTFTGEKGNTYAVCFRVKDIEDKVSRKYEVYFRDLKGNCSWRKSDWSYSTTVNNYMTWYKDDAFSFEFASWDDASRVVDELKSIIGLINK